MRTSKNKNTAASLKNLRRKSALIAAEIQLNSGKKPNKVNGKTIKELIDLTDVDKKRIEKEINTLKERIK